jgi:hypothetical protein
MYQEPHHDEEHMRLRRPDDERPKGGAAGFIFMPACIGMVVAVLLAVILPALGKSMSSSATFANMGRSIVRDLDKEFGLLANMKFAETNIWIYMLIGAVLGVVLRYFFKSDNV